jgi:hypothetical protein
MWSEEEFQEFVEAMESDNPISKSIYCQALWHSPSGDARVLPYLEAALEDARICLFMIPITFSDVRYAAALALVTERKTQNIDKPVILRQTIGTLTNSDIVSILDENDENLHYLKAYYENTGTKKPSSASNYEAQKLNILREAGRLTLRDFEVIYKSKGEISFRLLPKD